jgi:hypothetical protein
MSTRRYISAGTWIQIQDYLGDAMKVLVVSAALLSPLLAVGVGAAYGLRTGVTVGIGFAVLATILSLYLFVLALLIEPVRVNGLPYLER